MQTPRTAVGDGRSGARLETPESCRGYEVLDPLGQKVGRVETVFVNVNGEPEYLRVKVGRLRRRSLLLPVQFVAVDRERRTLTLG